MEYSDDSLAAWDVLLKRATMLPRDGGPPRVVEGPQEGNFDVFGMLESGSFLLYSRGGSFRRDLSPGRQWILTDILAMDSGNGSIRTVGRLPDRERLVAPDGFYWAGQDRYEIQFYDVDGTLKRILRRPIEPRAVEPSMMAEYVEAELQRVRQVQGDEAVPAVRQRLEEGPVGEQVPLFEAAFVDGDERLWVSRAEWPSMERSRHWSIFSSDGIWLGDVDAPERVQILDARGDRVLGIWRDEVDVPHVQLHRLVKP